MGGIFVVLLSAIIEVMFDKKTDINSHPVRVYEVQGEHFTANSHPYLVKFAGGADYYTKDEIDEIVTFYDSDNDGIVNAADYAYDAPGGEGGDPKRITNQDIDAITNKI